MNDKLRKIAIFLAIVAAAAGLFGAGMAFGAGGEPGSQGDPIVTLSYLESRLAALGHNNGQDTDLTANDTSRAGTDGGFNRLTLNKGQSISLSEGCMLIVYSGNGKIGEGSGMLNLSTGEFFGSGTSAVLYSIFLAPENGSLVDALSNMTVYVMGKYELR